MTAIALSSLLRAALLVRSWGELGQPWKALLPILSVGILYDLAFALYLSAPVAVALALLPERALRSRGGRTLGQALFFALLVGLYLVAVAEWVFWDEFSARFNFIAVDYLVYRREVTENIGQSYPLAWIFAGIAAAAAAHFWLVRRSVPGENSLPEPLLRRAASAAVWVLAALASVALLGQGPRELFQNNYAKELASDGPYQFFAAFRNNALDYRQFYAQGDDRVLSELAKCEVGKRSGEGGLYDIGRNEPGGGGTPLRNVVLVSVESLSADFLARFGGAEGLTPNLDALAGEGLLFTGVYATGTRTDRGLEALSLSVPPTPGRSLVKRPGSVHLYSLGKVFGDRGYDAAFLYGGRALFDNMGAFFSGNGYRVVDQTDLAGPEISFSNAWGVADEDLYRRTLREADADWARGTPFFFHVMTTSNHRPYTYPEGRIDIPSGTGRAGAVKYTDFALGRFVAEAKGRPWFHDTLFVLVADHCASSAGRVGLPVEKYHIPLLMLAPAYLDPDVVGKVASQIDIAPTVLSLLGLPYEDHFWGRDILSEEFEPRALIGNYQKLGLYEGGRLVILSPGRRLEVMEDPAAGEGIRSLRPDDTLAQEAMAYYQGADFVLRHGMESWRGAPAPSRAGSSRHG